MRDGCRPGRAGPPDPAAPVRKFYEQPIPLDPNGHKPGRREVLGVVAPRAPFRPLSQARGLPCVRDRIRRSARARADES
jgi:hypothetical protein